MYDISPALAAKVNATMKKCIKPESKFIPFNKVGDKTFKGLSISTITQSDKMKTIEKERLTMKRKRVLNFIDFKQAIKDVALEEEKAKKAKLATIDEKFCVVEV